MNKENKTKIMLETDVVAEKVTVSFTESSQSTHLTGEWRSFVSARGIEAGKPYRFELEVGCGIIVIFEENNQTTRTVSYVLLNVYECCILIVVAKFLEFFKCR